MNLTDRIVRNLAKNGPATAADVALAVKSPKHIVAGTLSNLHKQGRVRAWGKVRQAERGMAATVYEAIA